MTAKYIRYQVYDEEGSPTNQQPEQPNYKRAIDKEYLAQLIAYHAQQCAEKYLRLPHFIISLRNNLQY